MKIRAAVAEKPVAGTAPHGQQGGFGDLLTVGLFILQWPEHRVCGMPIDERFVADFGVPVRKYSPTSDADVGNNTFNVHPCYSLTAFPRN